jgi:hypothetical protein
LLDENKDPEWSGFSRQLFQEVEPYLAAEELEKRNRWFDRTSNCGIRGDRFVEARPALQSF